MIRLSALVLLLVPMFLLAQRPLEPVEIPIRNKGNPKDNQSNGLSYNGTEWFRLALANQNLEPELSLDNALDNPDSTIVMILGETSSLFNRRNQLLRFVESGGSLMIATDNHHPDDPFAWNSVFGIIIPNNRIYDLNDNFGGLSNCPLVTPAPFNNKLEATGTRIFRRVEGPRGSPSRRLLTNDSAILQTNGRPARGLMREDIAQFSDSARQSGLGNRLFQNFHAFAMAFHHQEGGKALLLADHSVFINDSMMVRASPSGDGVSFGTANYDFAEDTADWLAGSGRDRKTKCILIVDGRVQQIFALPPPPIPDIMPPPDLLAQALKGMLNPLLDSLQKDDFFNRFLRRMLSNRLGIWLAVGVVLFLALWRKYRAIREFSATSSNAVIETKPPPNKETLNRQTMREMISSSDWLFAARRRVRAWLTRFDVNLDQSKMPPVLVASGSNNAQAIKESLQRLWDVALGHVSEFNLSDWDQFNQDLERLAKSAKRGEWTFAVEK